MGGMFDIGWIMFNVLASGIVRKKEVVNIGFGILNLMISNGGFKSSSQSGKAFLILIFLERNDIERYIYIYIHVYTM